MVIFITRIIYKILVHVSSLPVGPIWVILNSQSVYGLRGAVILKEVGRSRVKVISDHAKILFSEHICTPNNIYTFSDCQTDIICHKR